MSMVFLVRLFVFLHRYSVEQHIAQVGARHDVRYSNALPSYLRHLSILQNNHVRGARVVRSVKDRNIGEGGVCLKLLGQGGRFISRFFTVRKGCGIRYDLHSC